MARITSPLKWHGGKYYLAPKLKAHLPKQYTNRVILYGGGTAETFAWEFNGISEVLNDIHGLLANFWHVISNPKLFAEFHRIISATPFSEELFLTHKAYYRYLVDGKPMHEVKIPPEHVVEAAICFFIVCRQSRQGLMKDFATLTKSRTRGGMNEQVSAWLGTIDELPAVHTRMRRVLITCRPALKLLKQQDNPDAFFYADPTYLPETRNTAGTYECEMTYDQHVELLEALTGIEGKFMLSGYPSKLYAEYADKHGWQHVDFELPNNASSAKEKEIKIERIWMNY